MCDDLASKPSHKRASNVDADEATSTRAKKKKTQERDDRVQEMFDELKQVHSNKYTTGYMDKWWDALVSNTSMFNRAGGTAATPPKKDQPAAVTQALADAATTIASALSPSVSSNPSSPARVLDQRSKQLSELCSLYSSGILNAEYETEKECILGLL